MVPSFRVALSSEYKNHSLLSYPLDQFRIREQRSIRCHQTGWHRQCLGYQQTVKRICVMYWQACNACRMLGRDGNFHETSRPRTVGYFIWRVVKTNFSQCRLDSNFPNTGCTETYFRDRRFQPFPQWVRQTLGGIQRPE